MAVDLHHGGDENPISDLHPDILRSHILTRLDGPTLAAAACASSELHSLSTSQKLWENICSATWPSINDPRVSSIISTFPHRSFFSDAYSLLHHDRHRTNHRQFPKTTEFISAVDIYYKNVPIFSKVAETETVTNWFMCSPFRVDLLEQKEFMPTRIQHNTSEQKEQRVKQLEDNITLSWILIDPKRKRAANLSSERPVSVERHWLTGEVVVKFATVMAGGGSEKEWVKCEVVVTCGEKEGREVHLREVYMEMEDMDGKSLVGKDSLVILQGAMEGGERKRRKGGKEGKKRYKECEERKRTRKERKVKVEKVLDLICITAGITSFVGFWSFMLCN